MPKDTKKPRIDCTVESDSRVPSLCVYSTSGPLRSTSVSGEDVAVHDAYSGVQCRHLCQAHETCAYWTYIVKAPQVPDSLQGRCFLKSSLAAANRELAHPFVVSGERLCVHFGEGLSAEAARGRVGLQTPVWRTSVGKKATTGPALLPGAGTEDWYREAAKALDEVGFATG